MRIRGFVLGVALLAAVGWCIVQESIKQTRARYQLADLARQEDEARKRLERLRVEEQGLLSPTRLTALLREQRMDLVVLGTASPEPPPGGRAAAAADRLPGEVLDEDFRRMEHPVNFAGAFVRSQY